MGLRSTLRAGGYAFDFPRRWVAKWVDCPEIENYLMLSVVEMKANARSAMITMGIRWIDGFGKSRLKT